MNKLFKRVISLLLVLSMILIQSQQIIAAALEEGPVQILSAEMDTASTGVSNLEGYYSNEEWENIYPQGLFLVEYSTYEVSEGGTDPENPEDVYLGIVVYRVGGNSQGATLTYSLTCVNGDDELYPDSVGSIEFAPQQSTAIAKIRIYNDDIRNGDQMLLFTLDTATTGTISNAGSAAIRIADDEPYVQSKVAMFISEVITDKSAGGVSVVVRRTENDTDYCTLKVSTADGTAVAGVDYEPVEQEIVFMRGQTEQTVMIPLIQSGDVYTQAKHFTLTMTDLKGCETASGDTLRLNITNKCDEDTKKVVSVDDLEADVEVDDSGALTDSSESIVNVNDHIDRRALLRTVIGTVNGTAVQSMTQTALLTAGTAGYWDATVVIPNSGFAQAYCTGEDWSCGDDYTDGNENLMLISTAAYDLNLFYAVVPQFSNISNKIAAQYPNTAFGYLTAGSTFDQGNFPSFIKGAYSDGVSSDLEHMEEYQIYYLQNWNYVNVNSIQTPVMYRFDDGNGLPYPNTTGQNGVNQKLFYMIYDDDGWDDTNFKLGNTTLYRTVIPFSRFDATSINENITDFQVVISDTNIHESYVQFNMDGFTWRITVDMSGGGGVGENPNASSSASAADRYGFYVGSSLQIRYAPIDGSASNLPVPQYFYLVDEDGGVHNSTVRVESAEMASDGFVVACNIPLETLVETDTDTLEDSYYMTRDQIQTHNDLVTAGNNIHKCSDKILYFQVELSLKPAITVNYGSLPTLTAKKTTTDGNLESDEEQKARVYGILENVVTFYDSSDQKIDVAYTINLKNHTLEYAETGFSYLVVNPEAAGGGTRVKSNLYDLDLSDFGSTEQIMVADCTQIGVGVQFTVYNENTTYLPPHISIDSVGVSSKSGTGFVTEFTANALAEYLNFEMLHYDTEASPALSYYTVYFTISDIYTSSGNNSVKEYPVTIWYESTDGTESWELLSFVFKGGASLAEAQNVEMEILCSTYLDVDSSTVDGVDAAGYKPVLQLLDYNSAGYQYVVYIPTYYDYQNDESLLMQTYSQRFMGSDGISIVMDDYDKGDEASGAAALFTVDAEDMQYVAPYMEPIVLESEGASLQSTYFEEQRNFYTYNDNVTAMSAMTFNWDLSSITTVVSKILAQERHKSASDALGLIAGTGPYLQHNDKQIVFGVKISLTDTENKLGDEKTQSLTAMFNADPTATNYNQRWNTTRAKIVSGTLDTKLVWVYNALTHKWDFSQFSVSVSGSLSFAKNIPIPICYNLAYASFSVRVGFGIAVGGSHVLDYVDGDGNSHYRLTFNGLNISPNFYIAGGMGVGAANLLSLEAGITFSISCALTLAAEKYVSAQQEFDINSVTGATADKYSIEFSSDWKTYTPASTTVSTYSYGKTLCESSVKGSTVVIKATGTAFQLVGLACPEGGEMEITVTDSQGNTQTTNCSTYSSRNELYKLLYHWERSEDYASTGNVDFVVTITNTSGKLISLDSFRVYNRDYSNKSTIVPASINWLTLRLAMYLKFCVVGINFSLDPAYLLVNITDDLTTITIGTIGHSKTWDNAPEIASSAPLLLATQSMTLSTTDADYFNTGEYSDYRTQTLLQPDISNTAKTQVLSNNGKTYAFYTVLGDTGNGTSFYQLYCSVDGGSSVLVSEDIFVADFNAFVDGSGNLAVAITCSDSTVVSVAAGADGKAVMTTTDGKQYPLSTTEELKQALIRTCVKLITVEVDTDGAVTGTSARVLGTTDGGDQIQDSNPVGVGVNNGACVFYTSCSSNASAGITSDWKGFNGSDTDMLNNLLSSLYQGNSDLYCTVVTDSGNSVTTQIPLSASLTGMENAIITVTSMDALSYGDTVSLAYTVEVANAEKGGYTGVLKQIHYRQITVGSDGSITASDTVVVDSVFDYDKNLSEIFGDSAYELSSEYYNSETGELYDSNILRNVQLEQAVLGENGTEVGSDAMTPCLFYQTNASINYVTYETLQNILNNTATEADTAGVLYNGSFDDYVIAVSPEGAISLIYNDVSQTSAYTDTLYIIDYCPDYQVWNKARQLTYTDVFDAAAYENHEPTGSLSFDDFSAFVDGNGYVTIALKSSYAPFSYEYGAVEGSAVSGNVQGLQSYYDAVVETDSGAYVAYMVTPIQDYDSDEARTDVYMITFEDRAAAAKVTDLTLDNELFVPGQEISAEITIENTGDYMLTDMEVSLYYRNPNSGSTTIVASQALSAEFLSGDTITTTLSYTVDSASIPDGTVLGVLITDDTGWLTFYDSFEDCYVLNNDEDPANDLKPTYRVINNAAELYFDATSVEIDGNGIMTYSVCLGNAGNKQVENDVTVYLRLYSYDPETNKSTPKQTLFGFRVSASALSAGMTATVSDTYNVNNYLVDGNLYYAFEISSQDAQFSTVNDKQEMQIAQQIPEISISALNLQSGGPVSTDGRIVYDLTLGDEFEINTKVLAQYFDVADLRVYEIGTSCLSIDNSDQNGIAKIKVVSLPHNQEGYIKLLISVDGTVINKYLYLHISNRATIDLKENSGDGSWSLSPELFAYATGYDLLCATNNGSTLTFDFFGGDFRLYGDRLTDGGSFRITVTDENGNVVVSDLVSTKAEKDDYGMMLYGCDGLDYGHYTVTVEAVLSDGERLVLDCVKHLIDTSGADTTPYTVVEYTTETLDAPLLSGRNRDASFTLTFSEAVELAEEAELGDITVEFAEYELIDGELTATGNTVIFTASRLDGNVLVMTAQLASTPGAIRVYNLADSDIPAGCLVSAGGKTLDTAIPNYSTVTYVLKESGIMSVMVADDTSMPNGSIQKSVQVKFMTTPDTSRLEGTRLLYITEDPDGSQRTVEFHFAGSTEDPRVAVYRADELTLQSEELTKLFRYQRGIVLSRDNYVLVTADGDYLENDITTVLSDSSLLDIAYTKLQAEQTRIAVRDGMLKVFVTYPEAVTAEEANASVQVKRILVDNATGASAETVLTLPLTQTAENGTVLIFEREEQGTLPEGTTVTYQLLSETIVYDDTARYVTRRYDGIAVNPALPEAQKLIYSTDAWIVGAEPFVNDQGMISAQVTFSTVMDEETLAKTALNLDVQVTEYTRVYTDTAALSYRSVRTVDGRTVAVYTGDAAADFGYEQIIKTYTAPGALTVPAGVSLLTAEGESCGNAILDAGALTLSRHQAADAQISLTPNDDYGFNVVMTAQFDTVLSALTMTNVYAYVLMETGTETEEIYLKLQKAEGNTLTFISGSPVVLSGDETITFTARNRFADPYGAIRDENGLAVSEILPPAMLVCSMEGTGMVSSAALRVDGTENDQVTVSLRVAYDTAVAEQAFKGSSVVITGKLTYLDGTVSDLERTVEFTAVENGNVVVYTTVIALPSDVDTAVLRLGSNQIITSGPLYSADYMVKLSAAVPEAEALSIAKPMATGTAIELRENTASIFVTYGEKITAENVENITLTAAVSGSPVVFTGYAVSGNVLELRAEGVTVPMTICVTDAALKLSGEAALYAADSGLAVSLAVPDAEVSFRNPSDGSDGSEDIPKTDDPLPVNMVLLVCMALVVLVLCRKRRT